MLKRNKKKISTEADLFSDEDHALYQIEQEKNNLTDAKKVVTKNKRQNEEAINTARAHPQLHNELFFQEEDTLKHGDLRDIRSKQIILAILLLVAIILLIKNLIFLLISF